MNKHVARHIEKETSVKIWPCVYTCVYNLFLLATSLRVHTILTRRLNLKHYLDARLMANMSGITSGPNSNFEVRTMFTLTLLAQRTSMTSSCHQVRKSNLHYLVCLLAKWNSGESLMSILIVSRCLTISAPSDSKYKLAISVFRSQARSCSDGPIKY